jgi:hypothetical protein
MGGDALTWTYRDVGDRVNNCGTARDTAGKDSASSPLRYVMGHGNGHVIIQLKDIESCPGTEKGGNTALSHELCN